MALLAPAEIRAHIPTDLIDSALQLLLDDAEAEIDLRCGTTAKQIDTRDGMGQWIYPTRQIDTSPARLALIVISERYTLFEGAESEQVLATDDWSIHRNGTAILRESDGTHPSVEGWRGLITLEYFPAGGDAELARRKRAQLDLVRIAIQYQALKQQVSGNHTVSYIDCERERGRILRRLQRRNRMPLA